MRAPTGRPSCEQVHGPLETCEPQNGEKQHTKEGNKRLYRLASKKGIRAVPRQSENRTGPRMAPRRNTRTKRTHGQNRRNTTKRRGKKQEKQQQVRGGGCGVLLDLSFVSSRRKKKKRDKTHDVVNPEPKTERTRQKKTRPDVNRIFLGISGAKLRENARKP